MENELYFQFHRTALLSSFVLRGKGKKKETNGRVRDGIEFGIENVCLKRISAGRLVWVFCILFRKRKS